MRCSDQVHRGLGQFRGEEQHIPRYGRETCEPCDEKVPQSRRRLKPLAHLWSAVRPDQLTTKLKSKVGIAAGGLPYPGQLGPREFQPQPLPQETVEVAQPERTDDHLFDPFVTERSVQI